mgnify:CR=1 FL=1
MIKAVIIGFAHMHVNEIALYMSEQPDFELAAIADIPAKIPEITDARYTRSWNLKNVKDNYCANVYDDYKKMLDEVKPDIAFILCENFRKPEVVEECAKRKINVSIEKPIAVSLDEAKRIASAVDKSGIEAVVNWPVMWRDYVHKMKKAIDDGVAGKPIKLRYINGHTGPLGKGAKHRGVSANADSMTDEERSKTWWHMKDCGGGVFLDISCYGCFFTEWFLGSGEKSAISFGANLNTPFGDTEDNFAGVIKYDGKMSVVEGTWTTPRVVIPSGPMMICTDGVVTCTGGAENSPNVKAYNMFGDEIALPEFKLEDKYKNMPWHYANHVKTGEPIHPMLTLDANVKVMALIDALTKSSESGKEEPVLC